ncbi:hypothetical protein D3C78_1123910 [compost metagenome]
MAPQQLQLGFLGMPVDPLAFGAEGQAVDVAADPAAEVPGQRAALVGVLPFQLVGEEQVVDAALMHGMRRQVGEGGGAVGVGQRRYRRARVAGRSRAVLHLVMVHAAMLHHRLAMPGCRWGMAAVRVRSWRRLAVPGMGRVVHRLGGLDCADRAQAQDHG